MYADAGLMFPFMQDDLSSVVAAAHQQQPQRFPHELVMENMLQCSLISEYDLGGEGDLFKAPEPFIENSTLLVDPITAAMSSTISSGEDAITETITAESMQNDSLDDVLYQCKKDLIERSVIEESISELLGADISAVQTAEVPDYGNDCYLEGQQITKSVSAGCLSSFGDNQGCIMNSNFLELEGLDFEAAFGLRRVYSESDIQHLSIVDRKSEERMQKLSRYWKKKRERNFGRKIKYACRKALADSQPRFRGRFAKVEGGESSKRCKLMQNTVRQQMQHNGSSRSDNLGQND